MLIKTYYQPELIATKDIPQEIASFMVFPTKEDCKTFMDKAGYLEGEYEILTYQDDDIEEPTFLNGDGEDISAVETEDELDDAYLQLLKRVKGHHIGACNGHEPIRISPTMIYENLAELYGVSGPGADKYLKVIFLTEEYAICEGDFDIPYDKISDVESFEALLRAIEDEDLKWDVDTANPNPQELMNGIAKSMLRLPLDSELGVVVEDENGEIRNITYMWFDREREMLRLTIGDTLFVDEQKGE